MANNQMTTTLCRREDVPPIHVFLEEILFSTEPMEPRALANCRMTARSAILNAIKDATGIALCDSIAA